MNRLAKFAVPRQEGVLARERLIRQIDESRRYPALWIAGAPGSGKTTLVAHYVDRLRLPCVWIRLDDADNDLVELFCTYRAAANLGADALDALPVFSPELASNLSTFSRRFFRALFATQAPGTCVVLDDVHELENDRAIDTIRAAIEEVPDGIHLVLISRAAPPAALAAAEASQRLVRFDEASFPFTRDELRALLPQHEAGAVDAIHALTEGWPAGVVLAARCWSTRGHARTDEAAGASVDDSKRSIFRFYAHEVLRTMPDSEVRFVEQISFLPEMTAAQAFALSGDPQAESILDSLYQRNLFTSVRRGTPTVYRLHALFREYLGERARRTMSHEALETIRARAVDELLARGHVPAALELLVESGDWSRVCRTLERTAEGLLSDGRYGTLRRWGEAVPREILEAEPALLYWMGQACAQEDGTSACVWYERAYTAYGASREHALGRALCAASAILAIQSAETTYLDLGRWIERLRDHLPLLAASGDPAQRLTLEVASFVASMLGDPARLHEDIGIGVERAVALIERQPHIDASTLLSSAIALLDYCRLQRDEVVFQRVTQLTEPRLYGTSPFKRTQYLIVKASAIFGFAMKANANWTFAQSRETLAEACAIVDREEFAAFRCEILGFKAMLARADRNEDLYVKLMLEASAFIDFGRPLLVLQVSCALGRVHLGRDEIVEAIAACERGLGAATTAGIPFVFQQDMLFAYASTLIAAGRLDAAIDHLARLEPQLSGRSLLVMQSFHALACALRAEDLDARLDHLRAGLQSASRATWAFCLIDLPKAAATLFAEALLHGIEVDFVRSCIERQRLSPPIAARHVWPWAVRVSVLGAFQLQIRGASVLDGAKVPRKQIELLQTIASFGRAGVPRRTLLDALWPGDASAPTTLDVTLHRLRKLVGVPNAIETTDGRLRFHADLVWCDTHELELLEPLFRAGELQARTDDEIVALADCLFVPYGGTLLADATEAAWLLPLRDRYRDRFVQMTQALGAQLERRRLWTVARELYARAIERENLHEAFYRGAIRAHLASGQHSEALAVYRRCRELLSIVLGIKPALETQRLVAKLAEVDAELQETAQPK